MAKRFTTKIPKKPLFKRKSYHIPPNYSEAYRNAGVIDLDEQMMLFHVTQFGGFRCKTIPKYLRNKSEDLSHWFKTKREFGFHHFRASPDFLSTFGDIDLMPLRKIWRESPVKDGEMKEYGFSDEECRDSREFLDELNDFYSNLQIDIPTPASGITLEDRINLARFHSTPFLVKKPRAGGRFFNPGSSFQRIESSIRQRLTINGKKTSEVDISAATLQFLGIVLGQFGGEGMLDEILSNGDPYQYFLDRVDPDIKRDDIKPFIYAAIYSDKKDQKSSVVRKFRAFGEGYSYKRLVSIFSKFFNAVNFMKAKSDFPPHVVIFREESRYAQKVLERGCLELRLPIIPIHDSFIITADKVSSLKRVMNRTSEKLYGRRLAYKVKY